MVVASEAIQLFGGNGYMTEYKVEQFYRDARVMRIYAGTDDIQVRAIARDLLTRYLPACARKLPFEMLSESCSSATN